MEDMNMIKKDLKEIQKSFNPEKSTYKVFDELIKHKYSSEEMINVLSKIRGIHKYPDYLKAQFLDVINNLNLLKEQEIRKKEAEKREEEKAKQQANTQELKDIINSLEKAKEDQKQTKDKNDINKEKPESKEFTQKIKEVSDKTTRKSKEFLDAIGDKAMSKVKGLDDNQDDGNTLFIILILLVIISLIAIGLLILLY